MKREWLDLGGNLVSEVSQWINKIRPSESSFNKAYQLGILDRSFELEFDPIEGYVHPVSGHTSDFFKDVLGLNGLDTGSVAFTKFLFQSNGDFFGESELRQDLSWIVYDTIVFATTDKNGNNFYSTGLLNIQAQRAIGTADVTEIRLLLSLDRDEIGIWDCRYNPAMKDYFKECPLLIQPWWINLVGKNSMYKNRILELDMMGKKIRCYVISDLEKMISDLLQPRGTEKVDFKGIDDLSSLFLYDKPDLFIQ